MTFYIEQPDIKIEDGYNPIFSLLQSHKSGIVLLTACPGMIEIAKKWLEERLLTNYESTPNQDGSVTYNFNCSVSTVARELVACGIAPRKILAQVKIHTIQDSYSCSFIARAAKTRCSMPTLFDICTDYIIKNKNKFSEQLNILPKELEENLIAPKP